MTEVLNDTKSLISDETQDVSASPPENSLKRNADLTGDKAPIGSADDGEANALTETELRQMHDDAKAENVKVHEKARKNLFRLYPVIQKIKADAEFYVRVKAQVEEAYPSWKFDRNPVLAVVKYVTAAETANAQKLAQKHASILNDFIKRELTPNEADELLHREGIEKLATGSRNSSNKKKPVNQCWDIRVSVSDELAEQIRLAHHGDKVQAVGIVILKDGETPSCEFRPLPE